LGRHGPTKARRGLGPGWATVFTLRAGTARPKKCLGFPGPNPFGTKHDGLGPDWPGPAQFPALLLWSYSYSTIAKNHASQTSPAVRNNELRASGPDYDFRRGALHMFRQFMDTSTFVSFLFYQSQCVIHSSMFSTHVYDKAYLSPLPLFPLLLLALALIIP
jgi:hypothetical protein